MSQSRPIDINKTPIDLRTFMSITDSNGKFETWTDIITEHLKRNPVSEDILLTQLRAPKNVIGDNITFEYTQNKNVTIFNDNPLIGNNKLTLDKAVLFLNERFMFSFEVDITDMKSAAEWSTYLSTEIQSAYIAKKDFENMKIIETAYHFCLATGNTKLIAGVHDRYDSTKESKYKALGIMLAEERILNRTLRNKYFKGYNKDQDICLLSQQLSLKLQAGLTAGSASVVAFEELKKDFQIKEFFGETYFTSKMYLGKDILSSAYQVNDTGTVHNEGIHTGQQIKNFYFQDLALLSVFKESLLYYKQEFPRREQFISTSRTKDVFTDSFKLTAAIDPNYGTVNFAAVSKIPSFPAYTDITGKNVPAMDLNTATGFNALRNNIYQEQPQLYKELGWDGNSNFDDAAVKKMWKDNTINWSA